MMNLVDPLQALMFRARLMKAPLVGAMATTLLLCCHAVAVSADPKPNVVVFLADDAGWGDYGFSGNQQVKTPNIDSIAKEGVSLDRFFVCPVCSPTRAEFLTGRYHPRGGVRGVSLAQERLNLDEATIADEFQTAGYATGAFGKWHNGTQWPYHAMARGFDEYFGHSSGHWGEYFDAPLEDNGRMIRTKGYIVDVCTDRAIKFIERNRDKPFFCYVPFTTPHSPWSAPPSNWNAFKDKPIAQTATNPNEEVTDETRCALAMIENQDINVGRVLSRLKDLKLDDNTIVLYFSDNGPNTNRWTGGMKGKKGGTNEGSVRSVCYWRWPKKLAPGRVVPQIAGAIDLLPTITKLAEIPRTGNKPLDGRDLTPLLFGTTTDWPDRMIFTTWGPNSSVRTQRHRLDDRGQLYDMTTDPGQTTPVNQREPEVTVKLTKAIADWRKDVFGTDSLAEKPKRAAGGVDSRPLTVGYREFPITMLPARDGEPKGTVRRSSSAPNCSYFVNWTSLDDRMQWNLDVHTTGTYEATVDYTCREQDVGAVVELEFRGSRLSAKIVDAWNPPLNTDQDTLPRPQGESQMKEFRNLKLGEIKLDAGAGPLVLRATEIPGQGVIDVRRITLTLK
ncbi:MAG: arylsulfatase [Pirellula sp.]